MADITLTPVRYYVQTDPYHYTTDNRPLTDLAARDEELAAAIGGYQEDNLLSWAYSESFRAVSVVRDANDAVLSANIVWPDGTPGLFTTDVVSVDFPGAIDAWHATYEASSGTKTVTQPTVTRNANGAVIAQPAITIS